MRPRVAIEHQDPSLWRTRALAETRTTATIALMIAMSRPAKADLQAAILERLDRLPLAGLTEEQQLDALRGLRPDIHPASVPDEPTAAKLAARLDQLYPSRIESVNRELCQLLVYLESPTAVASR